jgi:hypothetical protein
MQTATAARFRASTIPFVFATTSAVLLFVASATANVSAAIEKHDTWSGAFVAGAIALSVALLVAVALPAALSAFRVRQLITGLLAAAVFALAAAYSVTSALGILGKPRLEASMKASDADFRRADLRAERKRSLAERETLAPARPAAEVNGLITAKFGKLGSRDTCRKQDSGFIVKTCAEVAILQEEANRSARRSALAGTITRIENEIAAIDAPSLANVDAAALIAVLKAFGITADANVVNVVLMLIAVTLLEIGSGLSMAVAQSLSTGAPFELMMKNVRSPHSALAPGAAPNVAVTSTFAIAKQPSATAPVPSATVTEAATKITRLVEAAGGELRVSSKRQLGRLVDATHPTVGRALILIAATGTVVLTEFGQIVVRCTK